MGVGVGWMMYKLKNVALKESNLEISIVVYADLVRIFTGWFPSKLGKSLNNFINCKLIL